jgi:hypothetical protein
VLIVGFVFKIDLMDLYSPLGRRGFQRRDGTLQDIMVMFPLGSE